MSNKDRLTPSAVEVESVVLATIMTLEDAFFTAASLINADHFYDQRHRQIYIAIEQLSTDNIFIDRLTVIDRLRKNGQLEFVGGISYLVSLAESAHSVWRLEDYCLILKQQWIKRTIIDACHSSIDQAHDNGNDPLDILAAHEKKIEGLANLDSLNGTKNIFESVSDVIKDSEAVRHSEKEFIGVPSGLRNLDRVTMGFRDTDLIILAARPAMGKTGLMTSMAFNASKLGYNVGILSLEMSSSQLSARVLSQASEIDLMKIRNGDYSDEEFEVIKQTADEMSSLPLIIDDSAGVTLTQLKTIVRNMVRKYKCQMILIDQLNHINHTEKGRSKNDETGTVTRTLKALAKIHEVPIVLLHQLSRDVERRGGAKIPQLSDLRDSGNVEQDADIVMFIHRDEYYGIGQDENGESTVGKASIIIAKHRQGAVGRVDVAFNKEFASFGNLNYIKREWYD